MRRLKRTLLATAMSLLAINANAWPWISPYAYCMGNPVNFVDPDGRFIICKGSDGVYYRYTDNDGDSFFVNNTSGERYNGGGEFLDNVITQFVELSKGAFGNELLTYLASHEKGVLIFTDTDHDGFSENSMKNPKLKNMGI